MYCTKSDVQYALAPSGSTSGTAWDATDEAYNDAIIEAQGSIDSYVKPRYKIDMNVEVVVPGEPPTTVTVARSPIRAWTRDIAAYLLTLTYKRNVNMDDNDPIRLRYMHVMNQLREVRDGTLDLDLPSAEGDNVSTIGVYNQYEGKMFVPEDFDLGPVPNAFRHGSYYGY